MEYLYILLFFLALALFLEWKFRVHLYNSKKERIITTLVIFVIGVVWDSFAVSRQHWIFPGKGLVGIKIGILPIEEYLFFFIMPFLAITIYKVIIKKVK